MKKKHYYVLAWSKILREIYIYPDKESAENDENIMLSKNVDDVTFLFIKTFMCMHTGNKVITNKDVGL